MAESATYASISWPPSYGTPALLMNASGADKTGGNTDSARGSSRNYQVISALIGVDSEALAPPSSKLREFHNLAASVDRKDNVAVGAVLPGRTCFYNSLPLSTTLSAENLNQL